MKISGKGIVIILVFLVGIPLLVDLFLQLFVPKMKMSMSGFLFARYLRSLPVYLAYLVIAFTVIRFYNKYRENKRK